MAKLTQLMANRLCTFGDYVDFIGKTTLGFHHHKKNMVDPSSMIKTLRVQQWWLYKSTHCFNGGWNPRDKF